MHRFRLTASLITFALPVSAATCDVVITQRAFNVSDSKDVATLYNRTRSDMCK